MPAGAKKRKAARKKKAAEENNQSSIEEESSSKLESIDENTTMSTVDDGMDPSKENSSLGLPTDHALSVVEEIDELVANDHGDVLNSNEENLVHDANIAVVEEISDEVSNERVEAGQGLSCVDDSVAVVQENVQTLLVQQNMLAHQISEQLEGLKKMAIEGLCAADNTITSLQKLLDGLAKIQQIIVRVVIERG